MGKCNPKYTHLLRPRHGPQRRLTTTTTRDYNGESRPRLRLPVVSTADDDTSPNELAQQGIQRL